MEDFHFFSRAYEERAMFNMKALRCSMGEKKCACVQDLHARLPGPVIHASKCVLCNRKYGPGYYSSIDEYSFVNMVHCNSRVGFKVRYNVSDYHLVDDVVIQCNIPKLTTVLDCVHTMYLCDQLVMTQQNWFIRICTGTKCSNKVKRNKTNVLTNLTCRSTGDTSKSTIRDCNTSKIKCNSCYSDTTRVSQNEYGYVIVEPNIYVLCSMCSSPTLYNDAYVIGAVCNGCEMECRSLYDRSKNNCRICGKKGKGDGYCRKHVGQTPN